MPVILVRIPQLGEGLQEARLIEFLKQPGDAVKRDDPIYVMETDKATTEVESPYDGTLQQWLVEPDSVLPIGCEIAKMEVAEGVKEMPADHHPAAAREAPSPTPQRTTTPPGTPHPNDNNRRPAHHSAPPQHVPDPALATEPPVVTATWPVPRRGPGPVRAAGGIPIPPRTKRYLKEHGLVEFAPHMVASGTKLMPVDVDAFLADGGKEKAAQAIAAQSQAFEELQSGDALITSDEFVEAILPNDQQTLNYRMARGAQVALPATLLTDVDWSAISACRDQVRETGGPTGFGMLLWCITQAMKSHPNMRSSVSTDGKKKRTYHHVNLGVAVALPGDILKIAVVRNADQLDRSEFFEQLKARIEDARNGKDQIDASTTVTVSNIGAAHMRMGIPVVVTPAAATIALGAVRDEPVAEGDHFVFHKSASLTMAFDHRVMNGVGAANFLNDVRGLAAQFSI